MRSSISHQGIRPPTEEPIRPPREARVSIAEVGASQAVSAGERVLAIIPDLIRPRSLGRRSVFTLVVTDRRLIFARTAPVRPRADEKDSKGWRLFTRWRRRDEPLEPVNYWEMEPDAILRQTLVNFAFELGDVRRVRVEAEIPFVLDLDPSDMLKRDLDSELDDIVLEIPDKPRRRQAREFREDVDVVWRLTIESLRATVSFLLEYDPEEALKPFLEEKIVQGSGAPSPLLLRQRWLWTLRR